MRKNIYFLHGLMGTCVEHCGAQIRAWRNNHNVLTFDLPGHGRAKHAATRPYFSSTIERFCNTMRRNGRGHVIGVSYLGGTLAIRAALTYPEVFESLVLTGYVPEIPQDVFKSWVKAFLVLADQNSALQESYTQLHGERWRSTLEVIAMECEESYATCIAVSKQMLAQLEIPTLLLNGSYKHAEQTAVLEMPACNPLVQAGIIPGAGHLALYDQPEVFNLIVEKFWERV